MSDNLLIACNDSSRHQISVYLAPSSPRFLVEQCCCQDEEAGTCSGTLAWSIHDAGTIQGFILELDNGSLGSEFRVRQVEHFLSFSTSMFMNIQEVYDGQESMCAVDGLLCSHVYTARVKAYNQAGESAYSECITLHSSSGR
jgi:hypothetical protein